MEQQEEKNHSPWPGLYSVCVCLCVCAQVSRVLDSSQRFFQLPGKEKQVFSRSSFPNPNHGWVSKESER